jgi:hypothetical protein
VAFFRYTTLVSKGFHIGSNKDRKEQRNPDEILLIACHPSPIAYCLLLLIAHYLFIIPLACLVKSTTKG